MPRPTELLDLYAVTLRPPAVELVDGSFGGMQAAVDHLKANPDERAYVLTDVAGNLKGMAFVSDGNLLLLTSGKEAVDVEGK